MSEKNTATEPIQPETETTFAITEKEDKSHTASKKAKKKSLPST